MRLWLRAFPKIGSGYNQPCVLGGLMRRDWRQDWAVARCMASMRHELFWRKKHLRFAAAFTVLYSAVEAHRQYVVTTKKRKPE